MSDIIEELRDLKRRFIFQGGSEFALKLAAEIERSRRSAELWQNEAQDMTANRDYWRSRYEVVARRFLAKECRRYLDDFPGARAVCAGLMEEGKRCNDCPDQFCSSSTPQSKADERPARTFKDVVIDALIVSHIYQKEHEDNPEKALSDLLKWETELALDPRVSSDAQALIDKGKQNLLNEMRAWVKNIEGETVPKIQVRCETEDGIGSMYVAPYVIDVEDDGSLTVRVKVWPRG